MFDRSDPSLMLRNGGLTDDMQNKLRQAVERALKAEVKISHRLNIRTID